MATQQKKEKEEKEKKWKGNEYAKSTCLAHSLLVPCRCSLTAVGAHRKVAPHVGGGLKLDALDGARGGLEALVGVFRGDAGRNHVRVNGAVVLLMYSKIR